MTNNFFPLSSQELINRINKIPKIKLAILPTALEYLPNIFPEYTLNVDVMKKIGNSILQKVLRDT